MSVNTYSTMMKGERAVEGRFSRRVFLEPDWIIIFTSINIQRLKEPGEICREYEKHAIWNKERIAII